MFPLEYLRRINKFDAVAKGEMENNTKQPLKAKLFVTNFLCFNHIRPNGLKYRQIIQNIYIYFLDIKSDFILT